MSKTDTASPPGGRLERGAMGTADIVFFVLAGVAPMGVVVALLTLSIALGNGAGVPGTYAVADVVLALFAMGYVRMSRRIINVGGFYTDARLGLGRRAGGATAYIALLAYNAATIGIFGALAYFASQTGASFGVHISWQVWALIAYAIVAALGGFTTDAMQILVVTSLFAAFLAFHCNTARYHLALSRDGLLPPVMSRTHPKYGSPVVASAAQLGLLAAVVIGFTFAGQDPYLGMGISLYGLGVVGIVLLQAIAAAAIVRYFLRHRQGESAWASIIAPALGGIGLVIGIVLMILNYSTLTGSTATWVNSLPLLVPAVAAIGAVMSGRQPAHEPSDDDHAQIASTTDTAVTAPSGTAASV